MSLCSDGSHKNTNNKEDSVSDSTTGTEDFPLEEVFRGFEKTPKVLLTRLDITPYLRDLNSNFKLSSVSDTIDNSVAVGLQNARLSEDCSVRLVKEDLLKLKHLSCDSAAQNSRRSSIESNSDTDITMSNVQCRICEKSYSSEKKLQKHQENKHMIIYKSGSAKTPKRVSFSDHVIVHELTEYHKCRKCTKIFTDYKSLKMHMRENHKKRKCYICDYCKKKFVDRMFFKVHIKLHCDVCGLLSPNKSTYVQHRRYVCRVLKFHNCKTCDMSFFKVMDLKDHSYDHDDNVKFICDVCKDKFDSKCAVAHHISFLHSKKRPTCLYIMQTLGNERLYLCNFCDESSVERDTMENHTSTLPDLTNRAMTGYKDYYFCDQCFNKFDIEMDMLQHKWTHFLKNTDNSQVRQNLILRSLLTKPHNDLKIKTTYKIHEKIPDNMQPKVVLEKIRINDVKLNEFEDFVSSSDVNSFDFKKALVNPKSKKTIFSKYQCEKCGKYYSSNYCLNRHIETQHLNYHDLQCKVCEESFVWPSLLQSHKCIRLNLPEMPFDDARPEIHFDNMQIYQNGIDDLDITESENYLNAIDFDIPAPIVELTEGDGVVSNIGNEQVSSNGMSHITPFQHLGYKLIMQEVPIEF